MATKSLINHAYSAACFGVLDDPTPDCGHDTCGILCDVAMERWRSANEVESEFTLAQKFGGDIGRNALQELLDGGMTLSEAAVHLGVHPTLVTHLVVRDSHLAVLEAESLLRAGTTHREEIARLTGLSHQSVGRLAEAIGAAVVTFQQTDGAETARIDELRGQGWSVRAIATELGISKSAVSRRIARPTAAEAPRTLTA